MKAASMTNTELLSSIVGMDMARALAKKPLGEIFGFRKPRQMQMQICEDAAAYVVHPALDAAKELLARCSIEEMTDDGVNFSSPASVRSFLSARIGGLEHEVFWVLWLDTQNRLIAAEEMFRGTLTQTSVYPREVVIHALRHNAAGVILAHNHPSGVAEPSQADRWLTDQLKVALGLVDVKVLDHFIVTGTKGHSFAERGWL
ncbi:MAG: DNA repair protein RadC [Pseudomonadota bacterium]|nr:DNA repair protein RadC [Pseudomonadota bacterium]MDP1905507.1 DNA repair protein RadC [Pseudomonadota bacterium]